MNEECKMEYEQLDIFSYLNPKQSEKYCFDDDINEIHDRLKSVAQKYALSVASDRFGIWSHVPQFGGRMDFSVEVGREILKSEDFHKEIDNIVDFAEERHIELSPMWGAVFFFAGRRTATLSFYSTFKDATRRAVKIGNGK